MDNQKNSLGDAQLDAANLYREEMVTDLKVGSIQVLVPITADGSEDESRERRYTAQSQVMSAHGPIPLNGPIDASNLTEALAGFSAALEAAMTRLVEEAERMQREEASRIVVPGQNNAGPGPVLI